MMVRMTPDTHVPVVQAERNALCDPWRTRDLAAHLVLREHRPDLASGIWFAPLEGHMERGQAALAAGDYTALVEKVRSGPPRWSPTHFARVDALFNTTELVIHHEDALRGDGAVGPRREVPERTSRATLSALRKSASLMFRRAGVGVRLEAPGADPITAGKGASVVTVTGAPVELLLVASGRMRVADVVLDGTPEDVETLKNARLGVS